jgi:hypothetical protein
MVARARIVAPGLTGTNPGTLVAGEPVNAIPISVGDVKFDGTADIRATLELTTMAPFPTSASDLLTPYGNEIFIERGIDFGPTREWVSQGYYRIYSVDQDEAPDGPVVVGGRDRMSGIIDADRESPKEYPDGTSVEAVFVDLVGEVYPGATIQFDFAASTTLFSTTHIVEEDRYAFLKDIADSLGKIMYWDYQGFLQVKTAPDPTQPVFDVDHGEDGVVVKVSRSLNRDGAPNAVVMVGEQVGEAPPVRAVAYDMNPLSPTYWLGPYGKVPIKVSSSFVETQPQAQDAANAKLARLLGVPYSIDFTMVPHPGLEVLDPVRVSYSDRHSAEIHVIQTLTVPLNAEAAMDGTSRQRVFGGPS